jgi:uncharacterized protein (TIGR00251 family)
LIEQAIHESEGGVIIDIEVVPNAKVAGCAWDPWRHRIKLKVTAKAQKGKANGEILSFLSPLGEARIAGGMHSKEKAVFIGAEYGAVLSFLEDKIDGE